MVSRFGREAPVLHTMFTPNFMFGLKVVVAMGHRRFLGSGPAIRRLDRAHGHENLHTL